TVDRTKIGDNDNIGTVQQATFFGSVTTPSTASCLWGPGTSFNSFSADSDCPVATAAGNASAPATKIPAITFANMPAGEYLFITSNVLRSGSGSGDIAAFVFTEAASYGNFGGALLGPGSGSFGVYGGAISGRMKLNT